MKVHELKVWTEQYQAILDGRKRFEFRWDDRGFRVGDMLHLREYEPGGDSYSGESVMVEVTYIMHGPAFGLPKGYVVMSIEVVS